MRLTRSLSQLPAPAFACLGFVLIVLAGWTWFATMFGMGEAAQALPEDAIGIAVKVCAGLIVAAATFLVVATFRARLRLWALALALLSLGALPTFAALS